MAIIDHPSTIDEPVSRGGTADAPQPNSFGSDSPNLDFLRSIAVLCVFSRHIISHCGDPSAWYFQPQALGIFGVMAFFVHTSLVLMLSLERHAQRSGSGIGQLYSNFLVRRAFRIYPLSCAVVLLCWFVLPYAASDMGGLVASHSATTANLASTLTLTNNLTHQPYVLGTLWSLPLELQMYLFLPLLYLLVRKIGGARMLALWPAVVLFAFVCRYKTSWAPDIFGYAPCFLGGVIAYRMPRLKNSFSSWMLPLLIGGVLLAYMVGYGRFRSEVPLGWFACLALGVALPSIKPIGNALLKSMAKTVAKYSYGIYLTHIGAIWVALHFLPAAPLVVTILASAVVTAAASVAAFHLIEHPMIGIGTRIADRIRPKAAKVAAPV